MHKKVHHLKTFNAQAGVFNLVKLICNLKNMRQFFLQNIPVGKAIIEYLVLKGINL